MTREIVKHCVAEAGFLIATLHLINESSPHVLACCGRQGPIFDSQVYSGPESSIDGCNAIGREDQHATVVLENPEEH